MWSALGSLFTAIISVLFINELNSFVMESPRELLDQMIFGGVYNFGFIQVNELSELENMTPVFIISSAFKNFSPIVLLAVFVSGYLKSEFNNGGIRNFLLKGFSRRQVFLSKYIAIVVAILFLLLIYFLAYCFMAVILFEGSSLSGLWVLRIIAFFISQFFLLVSFSTICFMMVVLVPHRATVLFNASMVVVGTMTVNLVMLFTNGQLDLSRYWVLAYVIDLVPGNGLSFSLVAVGIITSFASFSIAYMKFKNREFN